MLMVSWFCCHRMPYSSAIAVAAFGSRFVAFGVRYHNRASCVPASCQLQASFMPASSQLRASFDPLIESAASHNQWRNKVSRRTHSNFDSDALMPRFIIGLRHKALTTHCSVNVGKMRPIIVHKILSLFALFFGSAYNIHRN